MNRQATLHGPLHGPLHGITTLLVTPTTALAASVKGVSRVDNRLEVRS